MRIVFLISLIVLVLSCNKEDLTDDPNLKLGFSNDTISFDTIFTSFGTVTKRLMVYNPYKQSVKISRVKLAKAEQSPYIINVNGENNIEFTNISLAAKDSMYVFVQLYLKNAGQDLPLFLKDSIIFETSGGEQNVKLISYAQDVHVLRDSLIQSQTWSGPKPYLVIGYVELDTLETLNIEPGVTIYFKRDANFFANGSVHADGNFFSPIVFQQERTDDEYDEIPGQWGGIFLWPGSGEHRFNWVTIKNGITGVMVGWDGKLHSPSLEMNNVVIKNMAYSCLYAYNAKIRATNCLIANSKVYNCYFFGGGEYQFYHSSIVNYYSPYDNREYGTPSFYLSNYFDDFDGSQIVNDLTNTFFRNCIIYGNQASELKLDMIEDITYEVSFDHNLIRGNIEEKYSGLFTNNILNKDPNFKDIDKLVFELDTLSAAKDQGAIEWGSYVPFDLKNKSRFNDDAPDMGAYERKE